MCAILLIFQSLRDAAECTLLHCLDALVAAAAAAVEVATEVADPYYSFGMVWDHDNTNDVFFAEKNSFCDCCCYCCSFG